MQPIQARAGSPVEHEDGHAARIALLLVGKRAAIARLYVCRRSTGGGSFAWRQKQPNRRDENAYGFPGRQTAASSYGMAAGQPSPSHQQTIRAAASRSRPHRRRYARRPNPVRSDSLATNGIASSSAFRSTLLAGSAFESDGTRVAPACWEQPPGPEAIARPRLSASGGPPLDYQCRPGGCLPR